jgi:hypothetical protein
MYLSEADLSGNRAREWADRVRITAACCDHEFTAYQQLTELQGKLIPICYGAGILSISSEGREARKAPEIHSLILQYLPTRSHANGHTMTPEERMQFVEKADIILHEAHRLGVQHNDVAPRNFCIDPFGRMYLLDFETARRLDTDSGKAAKECMSELLNFENALKLYGFLPRDVDWKYWAALEVVIHHPYGTES